MELSDSTLAYDRGVKASLYAEASIAEYWIVNLSERCLEVFRDPGAKAGERFGFGCHNVRRDAETESVAPLAAPEATVRVEDLLPKPVSETGS